MHISAIYRLSYPVQTKYQPLRFFFSTGQASTEMDKLSKNEVETGLMSISTDEILDKVLPNKQERTETDEISDNINKFYTLISLAEDTGHTSHIQMNCQSGETIDTICTLCGVGCSSNKNLTFRCDVRNIEFKKDNDLQNLKRTHELQQSKACGEEFNTERHKTYRDDKVDE